MESNPYESPGAARPEPGRTREDLSAAMRRRWWGRRAIAFAICTSLFSYVGLLVIWRVLLFWIFDSALVFTLPDLTRMAITVPVAAVGGWLFSPMLRR